MMDLHTPLQRHFGFSSFRPGQEQALGHILAGRDLLTVMPTGSGKSLIYQLGALLLPGVTLVISPLVALMKDQVDALTRRRIPVTFINSSLSASEQGQRLAALRRGEYKLVLVAPERLRSSAFLETVGTLHVSLLAIDEAHCLSQWGHDFRPDYLHIAAIRPRLGDPPPATLALTATATLRVQDDIVRLLGLGHAERVVTGFDRPNLMLQVIEVGDARSRLLAVREILSATDGAAIIYTGTRRDAEEVSEFVSQVVGKRSAFYHAGLDSATRSTIQDQFLAGDVPVIAATNAFGMGIDRADVRLVLHYTMPGTLEAYYQEAGRAGRDGLPAQAILLYSPKDRGLSQFFITGDAPRRADLRMLHEYLARNPRTTLERLEQASGMSEVRLRLCIMQLELANAIQRLSDEGQQFLHVRVSALSDEMVNAMVWRIEEHQQHRLELLSHMISYAETGLCRRRAILDYFSDRAVAQVPLCCDNCSRAGQAASAEGGSAARQAIGSRTIGSAVQQIRDEIDRRANNPGRRSNGSRGRSLFSEKANREVGETVEITAQMLLEGLSPDRIAQRRALAPGTVYAHLALLIGQGRVNLAQVVSPEVERPIRSVIDRLGSADLVAPIKQQLGAEADYDIIRCVAAAWKWEHRASRPAPDEETARTRHSKKNITTTEDHDLYEKLRAWRSRRADRDGVPVYLVLNNETLHQIAREKPLSEEELKDTSGVGPVRLKRYGADILAIVTGEASNPDSQVDDFLSHSHPRPLPGPWSAGWALDFHSRYDGDISSRGVVGDLVYRFKYCGERGLAEELAGLWGALLSEHKEMKADAIVPIPPSTPREFDPVTELARSLGKKISLPVLLGVLVKTRRTQPQKEMTSLAQKRSNVAGAFALRGDVRAKRVLLLDDLFDSGATLVEATRILRAGGAADVVVLTLTKTIHSDA